MEKIGWILVLATLPAAAIPLVVLKARRREVRPDLSTHYGQVRVVANIDAPNRNLSETLPRRNRVLAEADRHFYSYERVRAPRYSPNFDAEHAETLRPVQVIRVSSRVKREEIEGQIPPHLKVIFFEGGSTSPAVSQLLSDD